MPNLIELAEELSMDDIAELIARKMCLDIQELSKSRIDESEDEEEREMYQQTLSDPEAMIGEAQSFAFETLFHPYELSGMVDEAIASVAEEYVR